MERHRINALFKLGGEAADKADAEITAALVRSRGDLHRAAKALGMSYATLHRLFKRKRGYARIALRARAGEL
jgi:transcriptional regulator of acetoin/glycerol metabolism